MNNQKQGAIMDWKEQVAAWRLSGLSIKQFCQHHNLIAHQLGYYKRKFESEPAPSKHQAGFSEVAVTLGQDNGNESLSLRLPNGSVIEGISLQTLPLARELMRSLI